MSKNCEGLIGKFVVDDDEVVEIVGFVTWDDADHMMVRKVGKGPPGPIEFLGGLLDYSFYDTMQAAADAELDEPEEKAA